MEPSDLKIDEQNASIGPMGQKYLAEGERVALRLWEESPAEHKEPATRDYETVGYVLEGRAELYLNGETIELRAGDSWLVPAGTTHTYTILEEFRAVEATSPPARENDRDAV